MNIPEQAVLALMKLGYTQRECQFLYVVATFSGNFLRRQFNQFTQTARGKADDDFLKKAIASGHVREIPFRQNNYCRYHLCARPVYAAIDKENSSHRKEARPAKAIQKLAILDFVLDNFNEDYLEEEADKVQFFTDQKNISRDLLPVRSYDAQHGPRQTLRYFVDKSPVFLDGNDNGSGPMPVFTYFENEYESPTSFPAHLDWYKPLLKALDGHYRFIYVASLVKNFDRAEMQFRAVLTGKDQVYNPRLLQYFRLRKLWEAKALDKLSAKDFAILNQAENRFAGPDYEQRYQSWLRAEPSASNQISEPTNIPRDCGTFETYLLNL